MAEPPVLAPDTPYCLDDLTALYINCTLKPSTQLSHAQGLIDEGRAIDHDLAPGVYPDKTEHGSPLTPGRRC